MYKRQVLYRTRDHKDGEAVCPSDRRDLYGIQYRAGKKIIERKQIQILLTDIEMPQESGLDLVAWIRDNGYQIICLLLTGHQRFDYAHMAIMMHCFSYILKPDVYKRQVQVKKANITF